MSFPVPVKYLLNDKQDATVVVYNDGKNIEGLPNTGCFSQENVNKFVNRWVSGNLPKTVMVSTAPNRAYAFTGTPFETIIITKIGRIYFNYLLANNISCKIIVAPFADFMGTRVLASNTMLEIIDLGTSILPDGFFFNDRELSKIILRNNSMVSLPTLNAFNNTPFASEGRGGEIYIPKVLYDHLGDGSELDYKAAANWSTIDGYGTITWRQIEGSEYEFNYADGTPIGSV